MPTRPESPDPTGAQATNPFASMGSGLGAGLGFFQDWLKAAGSALPHLPGAAAQGGSGMPAWTLPTLDPQELDKRIQDLKTVQFWLEQNARMIAMSIQGLEVQRMTLSTLQGMNVSMDALRESLQARPDAFTPPAPPPPPPAPAAQAAPTARPLWGAPPFAPAPTEGSDHAPTAAEPVAEAPTPAGGGEAPLINPMQWWDTLTQQFTHLAAQAAQTVSPPTQDRQARQAPTARAGGGKDKRTSSRPAAPKPTANASTQASAEAQAKRAGTAAGTTVRQGGRRASGAAASPVAGKRAAR